MIIFKNISDNGFQCDVLENNLPDGEVLSKIILLNSLKIIIYHYISKTLYLIY